jgi:hypothetical protein
LNSDTYYLTKNASSALDSARTPATERYLRSPWKTKGKVMQYRIDLRLSDNNGESSQDGNCSSDIEAFPTLRLVMGNASAVRLWSAWCCAAMATAGAVRGKAHEGAVSLDGKIGEPTPRRTDGSSRDPGRREALSP